MRSLVLTAFLASALLPSLGCNLYFSGGDGDPPCEWGSADRAPSEPLLLRNPESGDCEDFGWGGGPGPCDEECGPCGGWTEPPRSGSEEPLPSDDGEGSTGSDEAGAAEEPTQPQPSWGYCESYCTGLDENGCLATEGCRGIYSSTGGGDLGNFLECWQTDFNDLGPVECEGLDAYTCSTSDDCVAAHLTECDVDGGDPETGLQAPECKILNFQSCHREPTSGEGCYGDEDCTGNQRCNASEICLPPPGGDCDEGANCDLPAVCYGYCVPTEPELCYSDEECGPDLRCNAEDICLSPASGESDAVCAGHCVPRDCPPVDIECPANTIKVCPENGCEADCTCEPIDPGACDGKVICAMPAPECGPGETPGVAEGCYTGHCIPLAECPDFECSSIESESMCIARDDCSPYYVGEDCECSPAGCSCADWSFDSCDIN